MPKVIYEKDGKIARITLNRPEVFNAIDSDIPKEISECVRMANSDESIHVIILSGAGKVFCSGYDLKAFAEEKNEFIQEMPLESLSGLVILVGLTLLNIKGTKESGSFPTVRDKQ